MEKYKLYRDKYICRLIQEVMFPAVKMSHPESYSVFQLREHTHGDMVSVCHSEENVSLPV